MNDMSNPLLQQAASNLIIDDESTIHVYVKGQVINRHGVIAFIICDHRDRILDKGNFKEKSYQAGRYKARHTRASVNGLSIGISLLKSFRFLPDEIRFFTSDLEAVKHMNKGRKKDAYPYEYIKSIVRRYSFAHSIFNYSRGLDPDFREFFYSLNYEPPTHNIIQKLDPLITEASKGNYIYERVEETNRSLFYAL